MNLWLLAPALWSQPHRSPEWQQLHMQPWMVSSGQHPSHRVLVSPSPTGYNPELEGGLAGQDGSSALS